MMTTQTGRSHSPPLLVLGFVVGCIGILLEVVAFGIAALMQSDALWRIIALAGMLFFAIGFGFMVIAFFAQFSRKNR